MIPFQKRFCSTFDGPILDEHLDDRPTRASPALATPATVVWPSSQSALCHAGQHTERSCVSPQQLIAELVDQHGHKLPIGGQEEKETPHTHPVGRNVIRTLAGGKQRANLHWTSSCTPLQIDMVSPQNHWVGIRKMVETMGQFSGTMGSSAGGGSNPFFSSFLHFLPPELL